MLKKIIILFIIINIFLIANISAYGPAGHYILLRKVYDSLPVGSRIKKAITNYPRIAATGALGPDIGYADNPIIRASYAPWADRYHYDHAGSMAGTMLKSALRAHDERWIAFAAGWLTHVIGDMSIHGFYINPEAGVYLDSVQGRKLHKSLEINAEPFMWTIIGGRSEIEWAELSDGLTHKILTENFCRADEIPCNLIDNTSDSIWGKHPGTEFRIWYQKFIMGLNLEIGYEYLKLNDALTVLNINDRKKRLTKATATAISDTLTLLLAAESNDYSDFSDGWNLDAIDPKYDHRSIGTLVVSVKTADKLGAGTDADIYFGFVNSTGSRKQWKIDKEMYNDLEQNDSDDYYFYLNDPLFTIENINKVYLMMGEHHGTGPDWKCSSITIWINGKPFKYKVDQEFNDQGDLWEKPINLKL